MQSNHRVVDVKLLNKALKILQKQFVEDVKITSAEYLSEPERRNVIVRLLVQSTSMLVPKSVILKQSLPQGHDADNKNAFARFARDWAGLEFTSSIPQSLHNTPYFYGSDHELQFILIEDLGEPHVSLVDSLTAANRENAIAALERYMKALGSFHASSFNRTGEYQKLLSRINPDTDTLLKDLQFTSENLIKRLKLALSQEKIALPLTEEFLEEVNQIIDAIYLPGPFTVLTHGDIAPDNVFDHDDDKGLQLIDFEWCSIRNALLDGCYLRMNVPTGWCAKTIPEDVLNHLETIYRNELTKKIPAASNNHAYHTAYVQACGFHMLQQMANITHCLEKDELWGSGPLPKNSLWNVNENFLRPRVISRLLTFAELAKEHNMFPHIRKMSEDVLAKIKILWPDATPLDTYPAFKTVSFEAEPNYRLSKTM